MVKIKDLGSTLGGIDKPCHHHMLCYMNTTSGGVHINDIIGNFADVTYGIMFQDTC
jgi:hypothetical protein